LEYTSDGKAEYPAEDEGRSNSAMHAAVVQLNSQDDVPGNLDGVRHWVAAAAEAGARFVTLPENFAFMGDENRKRELSEPLDVGEPPKGPIAGALAECASRHGVWVLGGGMPERSESPDRPYNTSVLVDPQGRVAARYRKVHLFDVSLADGASYCESGATTAGTEATTADVLGVRVGLSVCYDVRFPELYRRLVEQGARILTVPAAFTLTTGKDHWHALLRARAIENLAFVLAPAQHGKHPLGKQTYGKALICDPWGEVIAQCAEGEGFALARLDLAYQDRVRKNLPALTHRKWG
jgi:predicted amidohydrolase